MTYEQLRVYEEQLLKMNPEERQRYLDKIKFRAQGLTGIPSEDEIWMKQYRKDARDIVNNMEKNRSVSDVILDRFDMHQGIDALRYFNLSLTRPDFKELVAKWAKAFREIGVEADEVVPIYGTFFPDICAMLLALNQIGAIAYPLKLDESKEDFEAETAESKVAVVYDGMWNNVKDVFSDDRFKYVISVSASDGILPPLGNVVRLKERLEAVKNKSKMPSSKKFLHAKDMLEMAEAYRGEYKEEFKPGRIAYITSSSGSTIGGQVKGIMSTNEAALAQIAKCEAAEYPFEVGAKVLTNLPPTASTAMVCLFLYPLYKGLTIIDEPRLDEENYFKQIMHYKPQIALMTGSFWKKFFRELQKYSKRHGLPDLSFLRMPIIGGEGVTPSELDMMNEFLKLCGSPAKMFVGYGMSEFFSVLSVQKDSSRPLEDRRKDVTSVGLPLPGVKVGVFDKDGNELGYNQRGELRMKDKDVVMQGYYRKPELTAKTLSDGWLRSGDIAELDEIGHVYYYGRHDDITVLPSGREVYLFDIANTIRRNLNVEDAMVFAIPLANGKKALMAHVIFEPTFYGDKKAELENIDYQLKEAFNGEVVIDGYKEYERAFIISPTTAKADRKAMYKDRRGYKKIVDGEEYLVDLIDGPNGTFKAFNKKEIKNIKKLKKQM